MRFRVLVSGVLLAWAASASASGAPPQAQLPPNASEHVRSGVSHYERAFYDLVPHKRGVEAEREFDLAVADFERELELRPGSVTAHGYLARIHAVRKEWTKAAAHYDHVVQLSPMDVDACVLSSLAWIEVGDLDAARARLTMARGRTTDPVVLARLAEYAAKLESLVR